jgi:parvulin-like peptidyl-prolyl isomerase
MKLLKLLFLGVTLMATVATARTVVTVNGTAIDDRDLFSIIQKITRGQYASLPDEKKKLAQNIALDQAISLVLMKQEASKSDIKKSKAYKKAFVEYVKNVVEPELSYQVWVERELNKMKASDKEIKKYYNANKDRFNQPKLFHVHHLLSKTEKEAKDLLGLINKAKNKKAAFMKLASEKMGTPDTGASDLGKLHSKSNMAPAFKAAYLKMKAHSFSKKPVKTQFGYHVIFVDSVTGGKAKSFAALKPIIAKNIKSEKLEKVLKDKAKALREKAVVKFK